VSGELFTLSSRAAKKSGGPHVARGPHFGHVCYKRLGATGLVVRQMAHGQEVVGSNPRTVYWMDVSNLLTITLKNN